MRLKIHKKGSKHQIVFVLKGSLENEKSPIDIFLDGLGANFERSKIKLGAVCEEIVDFGIQDIPYQKFHLAKSDSGVYRISDGRLRLYCFFDNENRLIVCSHGCIKQTQATENKVIKDALKLKKKFENTDSEDIELVED